MSLGLNIVFEVVSDRLPEFDVDCVMIGGYAVNHYGYARATQDVDFMITASDERCVRKIMKEAGFTGIASHENVVFFHHPEIPLRVDFLKVARETMSQLLLDAVEIEVSEGRTVKVPCLRHLIAMKIFAMKSGSTKRMTKDMPDVVQLVIRNELDLSVDIKPLCEQFGTSELYERICEQVEVWRDA